VGIVANYKNHFYLRLFNPMIRYRKNFLKLHANLLFSILFLCITILAYADDAFNEEAFKSKGTYNRDIQAGAGYSSDSQQVSLQKCYDAETNYLSTEGTVEVKGLLSFNQLVNTLKVHTSSKTDFFFFSDSDESHYLKSIEDTESSLSLNFVHTVKGKVSVNLKGGGINGLNQLGKDLYQDGNNRFFGIVCGDQYITGFTQGAMLLMSINIHFADHSEKENFEQHRGGSSFLNIFSSSEDIQRIINQHVVKGYVTIQAYQKGGDPGQLSKILNKDPSGHYYAFTCDMQNMVNCVRVADGMLDYAKDNFPNQINFNPTTSKGLVPLGIGFSEYIPIGLIGLKEPTSLVTDEVIKARTEIAEEINLYRQYENKISELINSYPGVWDRNNNFYKKMQMLLERSKKNLNYLQNAKECFNMPPKCMVVKKQIVSKIDSITQEDSKFLPDSGADYNKICLSCSCLSVFLSNLGFFYCDGKNDCAKAIEDYTEALKLNDKWIGDFRSRVLDNRGDAYYRLGNYAKAIEDCTEALKLNDKWIGDFRSRVLDNRGDAYSELGNYAKVIEDCTEALKLNDKWIGDFRSQVLNDRNCAYYRLGNYAKAIEDCTEALKLNDKWIGDFSSLVLDNRGNAYSELGNYAKVIEDCTEALKLNDKWIGDFRSQILTNRGNAYSHLGNYAKAIEDYTEALKLNDKWIKKNYFVVKEHVVDIYSRKSKYYVDPDGKIHDSL
jgi:tetratricopeptide (TPR) repeat protein